MEIEGRISILVSQKGATIEINDDSANVNFLEIKLSPEQFMACLGRLSNVKCQLEVKGLDKVGKTHENSTFEFKLPDWYVKLPYKDKAENYKQLSLVAQNQLSDGWIAENYFGSQNSFFTKDGEEWARVTIRRWI